MADLIFQVLPRNSADRRQLVAAVDWKRNTEETAYLAESRFVQGQILFEEGDLDAATTSFQEALRYRADHIQALVWLSRVFTRRGDVESSLLVAQQSVMMSDA